MLLYNNYRHNIVGSILNPKTQLTGFKQQQRLDLLRPALLRNAYIQFCPSCQDFCHYCTLLNDCFGAFRAVMKAEIFQAIMPGRVLHLPERTARRQRTAGGNVSEQMFVLYCAEL